LTARRIGHFEEEEALMSRHNCAGIAEPRDARREFESSTALESVTPVERSENRGPGSP